MHEEQPLFDRFKAGIGFDGLKVTYNHGKATILFLNKNQTYSLNKNWQYIC